MSVQHDTGWWLAGLDAHMIEREITDEALADGAGLEAEEVRRLRRVEEKATFDAATRISVVLDVFPEDLVSRRNEEG